MSNVLFGIDLGTNNIKIFDQSSNQIFMQKNVIAIKDKKIGRWCIATCSLRLT